MAEWSKALPVTASWLSPLAGLELQAGACEKVDSHDLGPNVAEKATIIKISFQADSWFLLTEKMNSLAILLLSEALPLTSPCI